MTDNRVDSRTLVIMTENAVEFERAAKNLEGEARELRKKIAAHHDEEMRARPMEERLVYAAYSRCPCGYGLAYDQPTTPAAAWTCAGVLLGTADKNVPHDLKLPFAFYEVKSENQPSANGATTRGTVVPQEVVA